MVAEAVGPYPPRTRRDPGHARRGELGDVALARDGKPLAGYHGGTFYLRNRQDNVRLYVGGNLHLDARSYFGPGVTDLYGDSALTGTAGIRRGRVQLAGELFHRWQFLVQPEWGPTAFDNASGRAEVSAGRSGQDPDRSTAQFAAVQAGSLKGTLADAYVNYGPHPLFNMQVGQFQVPFTMENRTSSNTTTFMENAVMARALGAPLVREIGLMFWGAPKKNQFYYSAGFFLGEGPNRPNADNKGDFAARVYARPFTRSIRALSMAQIGASVRYGMRDKDRVAYDLNDMRTQGGFAFWRPTYTDSVVDPLSANKAGRLLHVIPSGSQAAVAAELRVPWDRFELRSEFVYADYHTREAVDGYQLTNTERFGKLTGFSYYVQFSWWPIGKPFVNGVPGEARPPSLDLKKHEPAVLPRGVELVAKWEQLRLNYEGASRAGELDETSNLDGKIRFDAFSLGANYWATRHMRFTINYVLNRMPDSSPTGDSDQRARAPGNLIAKGIDDDTRSTAHTLHELSARLGVAF